MKRLLIIALLAFCAACSSVNTKSSDSTAQTSAKSDSAVQTTLPKKEKEFIDAIELLDKKSIVAQLGEPAKADDVKIKGSNRIVASIWHYHNINTNENGVYYQTTELDFIGEKVVQVVFLNNDGSEVAGDSEHTYDLSK